MLGRIRCLLSRFYFGLHYELGSSSWLNRLQSKQIDPAEASGPSSVKLCIPRCSSHLAKLLVVFCRILGLLQRAAEKPWEVHPTSHPSVLAPLQGEPIRSDVALHTANSV
jgi:hypothetical protein